MRGDRGEDVPPVKGPADVGEMELRIIQCHRLCQGVLRQHIREQAVVGADINEVADLCRDRPPRAADTGVYNDQVNRPWREVSVSSL